MNAKFADCHRKHLDLKEPLLVVNKQCFPIEALRAGEESRDSVNEGLEVIDTYIGPQFWVRQGDCEPWSFHMVHAIGGQQIELRSDDIAETFTWKMDAGLSRNLRELTCFIRTAIVNSRLHTAFTVERSFTASRTPASPRRFVIDGWMDLQMNALAIWRPVSPHVDGMGTLHSQMTRRRVTLWTLII
jgi:hypothetical protein